MATQAKRSEGSPETFKPQDRVEADATKPALRSRWWLRPADQLVLAVVTAVALALLGFYWLDLSGWGSRAIEIERLPQHALDFRVAPNKASWVEWAQLPGLGEVLAKRIVKDGHQNGPYRTPDDLLRVRGIGPKKLEAIRPFLDFPETSTANDDPQPIGVIPSQPKR